MINTMACRKFFSTLSMLSALLVPTMQASPVNLDGLVSSPPFNGPTAAAPIAASNDAALEFRGVLVERGELLFSLYDSSSRSSLWVGMNEPGNPYVVRSYDSNAASVAVQFQGRTLTLLLKQAKVVAMAQAAPQPPAVATQSPANTPPNATPQASATEATRLAAVADEIRRRRALRQQAAQANTAANPGRN